MEIFYVWDALCGWCFAFSRIISTLKNEFSPAIDIKVLTGGLAIGDKVGPVSQRAPYIKKRIAEVERIGGVRFSEKYIHLLDEGTAINDSLPPSIAFMVFKSFREQLSLEWAFRIQHALFIEGKDLNNVKVYLEIAEKYEINKHAFLERYQEHHYRKQAENDFSLTRNWGVNKYPSLVLQKGPEVIILKKGFASFNELQEAIKGHLEPQ